MHSPCVFKRAGEDPLGAGDLLYPAGTFPWRKHLPQLLAISRRYHLRWPPRRLCPWGCLLTAWTEPDLPAPEQGGRKGNPKNHKGDQVTPQVADKYVRLPVGHCSHLNIGVSYARINSNIQM